MRIAFVTSVLEPEADGVGDYTRRLASELERTGHTCRLISLNESPQPQSPAADEPLRLGAERPWEERIALARQALDTFQPDWMSLQFVCYGFDPRGILRRRGPGLASLFSSRRAHLMFHELWAGERKTAGWKERFTGAIQRRYVRDMVARIEPRLVTTTNAVYRAVLGRYGIAAREYPLFGGLEPETTPAGDWLWQELRRAGVGEKRDEYMILGFFGTIQTEWSPEPLFPRIAEAARKSGKRPVIVWVGHSGGKEATWNEMSRKYALGFSFLRLGSQPAERVSELLNTIDAGISTMPVELILKSSTAVAMFEHGVPVIVSRNEPFRGIEVKAPAEPLLCSMDDTFVDRLAAGLRRGPHHSRRPEAAANMARDLQ